MGWDASLAYPPAVDLAPAAEAWTGGYTHNTNGMVKAAADAAGIACERWLDLLDGSTGAAAAGPLEAIVAELHQRPDVYEAMNPENGWGDRAGITALLAAMALASQGRPDAVWRVAR